MRLLAIDTSSARCSAALWCEGRMLSRGIDTARDHARLLLPMIDELLREATMTAQSLEGIAFGRGPGSFTGLRIAASCAQGLALGAGCGVLPISSLHALAAQALRRAAPGPLVRRVLACMDARMSEVYWGAFDAQDGTLSLQGPEQVGAAALVQVRGEGRRIAAGKGLGAWPSVAEEQGIAAEDAFGLAEPDATDILQLALQALGAGARLLPPEGAQPVYLRDQVVHVVAPRPPNEGNGAL